MITTNYRGIEITYDENNEKWTCEMGDDNYRSSRQNLKDCRAAIDKFLEGEKEVKKKFERFDVIRNQWSRWETVTVTSITDNGANVWIVDGEGKREKVSSYACRNMYLITEDNLAAIETIKQREQQIEDITELNEKLRQKLTTLNPATALKTT